MKMGAADFGTQAYILIEQIIQGLAPAIPPQFANESLYDRI